LKTRTSRRHSSANSFVGFSDDHPEYDDFFRAVEDPVELLGLVNQLAAKGVFPTADGWYRNGERHLDGDFEAFCEIFDELNQPRNDGNKQSKLRSKLGDYGNDKCYLPDAPEEDEIRGGWGEKQVPDGVARLVFDEQRESLKNFVHDVYHEYLEFALSRNYLNFSFLQLFAFVLLCDDHRLRDDVAFEYVMIDEFQDSSEIQFKLALLLANTNNVCVVGDWKQSIYSFQYAAVENITEFESGWIGSSTNSTRTTSEYRGRPARSLISNSSRTTGRRRIFSTFSEHS